MDMKIYFAGAIRAGRRDAAVYQHLIRFLGRFATVLTEHVGSASLLAAEKELTEDEIFRRDITWLTETDAVVAEVSTPSLGVGYELARAEALGKPVLCLYRRGSDHALSAMLAGNPVFDVRCYADLGEAEGIITGFLSSLSL